MGQQQLILLVVGTILITIAIVVGLNLFAAYNTQVNRDAIIADIDHLSFRAMEYFKKPTSTGGGGNSFVGFTVPGVLLNNPNGEFSVFTPGTSTTIVLKAIGTETGNNGTDPVEVRATVTNSNVIINIIN